MDQDFYFIIGSFILAFVLYTWLMIVNYRNIVATKQERLADRRKQRAKRKAPWRWPI
jgi:uncharacterized membrane protein